MVPEHPRPKIDFGSVLSDLRLHVLDTLVKRGAELSTDHHLVVSWVRGCVKTLDRTGKPKRAARVNWECLEEAPVREIFNSNLRRSFYGIPVEVGDIKHEWAMFKASTAEAAAGSCCLKVLGASRGCRLVWWFPCSKGGTRECVLITGVSHFSASPVKSTPGCWNRGFGR